jgi:hypothetical protein
MAKFFFACALLALVSQAAGLSGIYYESVNGGFYVPHYVEINPMTGNVTSIQVADHVTFPYIGTPGVESSQGQGFYWAYPDTQANTSLYQFHPNSSSMFTMENITTHMFEDVELLLVTITVNYYDQSVKEVVTVDPLNKAHVTLGKTPDQFSAVAYDAEPRILVYLSNNPPMLMSSQLPYLVTQSVSLACPNPAFTHVWVADGYVYGLMNDGHTIFNIEPVSYKCQTLATVNPGLSASEFPNVFILTEEGVLTTVNLQTGALHTANINSKWNPKNFAILY